MEHSDKQNSAGFIMGHTKRDFISTVVGILALAKGGTSKTMIATRMGLNFQRASKYVELLVSTEHLRKSESDEKTRFVLSERGDQFLSRLQIIASDVEKISPGLAASLRSYTSKDRTLFDTLSPPEKIDRPLN